jgi:hypothetical protein
LHLLLKSGVNFIGGWNIVNFHYFLKNLPEKINNNMKSDTSFMEISKYWPSEIKRRQDNQIIPVFYANDITGYYTICITLDDKNRMFLDIIKETKSETTPVCILYQTIPPDQWDVVFIYNEHFRMVSPYHGNLEREELLFSLSNILKT